MIIQLCGHVYAMRKVVAELKNRGLEPLHQAIIPHTLDWLLLVDTEQLGPHKDALVDFIMELANGEDAGEIVLRFVELPSEQN